MPTGVTAGQRGGAGKAARHMGEVDAEFIFLLAGGDLGVGARIDVRD